MKINVLSILIYSVSCVCLLVETTIFHQNQQFKKDEESQW